MISSVIGSGLSLMSATFSVTDFLQVLLNPFALITALFYSISLLINSIIYPLAAYAYTLFPIMCELDFSALAPVLQNIISRIEVFIGIFMLFVVAFNLLQYMVDPDKKEGATSKLITKIVVALILLVSSSFIFGILDELQTALVSRSKDNIAQTLLFGKSIDNSEDDLTVGRRIVYAVFFNMYENQDYGNQYGYDKEYNDLVAGGSFLSLIGHLWQTPETYNKVYFHYPFLAEVFGIFLIILFGTFAIDIGVRNITLLFLRIMFPIAAIGYVTPKGEGILSKYISTYISTYVQIFFKTFMIYLLLYIFLWFMEALTSIDGALFGNMSLDDTTKTILLLLIAVALFTFFTKGLPTILKNIFGIEMSSSLGSIFGKALGFAAAGASLAVGGIAGGIMGKAAGTGAKGVLKGAVAGAKGGAQAGWNAGKQVSSGNIGGAVIGYGRGMSGAYGSAKKTVSSTKTTAEVAAEQAHNDEKKYEESQGQLAKESAILDAMEKPKEDASQEKLNEYNAQAAKVAALQNQTSKLAEVSQRSANKAKKLDANYVSNAEKSAIEAEKNYNNKKAAYNDAVNMMNDYSVRFGANSAEYKKAAAVVDSAKLAMDAAQRRAVASAEEAKKWNENYNSSVLVASNNAKEQSSTQSGTVSTNGTVSGDAQSGTISTNGTVSGDAQSGTISTNGTVSDDVKSGTVSAEGTVSGDVKSGSVSAEGTVSGDVKSGSISAEGTVSGDVKSGTVSAGTANTIESKSVMNQTNTMTKENNQFNSGVQLDSKPVASTVNNVGTNIGGETAYVQPQQVGGTIETNAVSNSVTTTRNEVVGNPEAESRAFENIRSGRSLFDGIGKDGTVENTNLNHVNDNSKDTKSVEPTSNYDGRKDADSESINAENEKIRRSKVEGIRGAFGTNMKDSDNEGDDTSQILEIADEDVDPIDAELESIMQNDIRAYGEKASRRFRELTEDQRMDAVLAMKKANQEAHDAIKSIAKDLIKQGMSVRDAYEEARKIYNRE